MRQPYTFDEFFASGREESVSPFVTPNSRHFGKALPLKGAIFAAILLAVALLLQFIHPTTSLICLSAVYFLVGTPALLSTIDDLRSWQINIDILMTLAAFLSIAIGNPAEGALLLVLFELSGSLENLVTHKTKDSLAKLQRLAPKVGLVLEPDGSTKERGVQDISIGTSLLVKTGELVPLDGEVIAGSSFVTLSHLTGEATPTPKREGDPIQAGSRLLDGQLTIQVTRASIDSTLNQMIALIHQAAKAKPKLERLFDRLGKWYSITIILLSALFALGLPLFFSTPFLGEEGSIYRSLAFLIAASPCALIIALPTAYLSAISSCARKGILLKGGTILDRLANCSIIAFDKTGTLTTGKLQCTDPQPLFGPSLPNRVALAAAAGLEQYAHHPIADAILCQAKYRGISPLAISHFKAVPGYGLEGEVSVDGVLYPVAIGHPDFIKAHLSQELHPHVTTSNNTQHTFLLIGTSLFLFYFQDEIRAESFQLLPRLLNKFQCILLTGDHTESATEVARILKIETVYGDLRPEDKLDQVATLSQEGGLIMVGDGINDAPALARATVGISLGKIGSGAAIDASDVVFLQDDISLLDWLIEKANQTTRIVRQNLILALAVICLATTPALLGYLPLWLAVILHEGGTVIVGLNSLRLLSQNGKKGKNLHPLFDQEYREVKT